MTSGVASVRCLCAEKRLTESACTSTSAVMFSDDPASSEIHATESGAVDLARAAVASCMIQAMGMANADRAT